MKRLRLTIPLFSFFFLLLLSACKRDRTPQPMPESVQAYIYAYTQGVISRTSVVNIQLASLVASEDQVGQAVEGKVVQISPTVSGEWKWTDRQTISFTPAEAFAAGTDYLVRVDLTKLFDHLPKEAHSFEFGFRTREPFVSLSVDGLSTPQQEQREKQTLSGQLQTSDFADSGTVEKMLSARQSGKTLPLDWSHNGEGTVHYFTVNAIERGQKGGELQLEWDGQGIGATQKGSQTVEVPAIGDFKVTTVKPVGGNDPHLLIHFSDPLKTQQQLSGLVTITNTNNDFRYTVKGQQLQVFIGQAISGEQEVRINTGIQNSFGDRMPRASRWDVEFTSVEPQVRLVGNGVVLPNTEGLLFPFEAIGLQAVEVEIFKIYHNNILQFLQVNSLSGNNSLQQVGKVVLRKEITLSQLNPTAEQTEWTRYALDLQTLIEADPQAIYQVRIGFRQAHSTYPCADQRTFSFQENDYYSADESMMSAWYGIEGYYNEYEWEQRDDPCFPAYYNSNRFVQRNVLASNLGIIAKGGDRNQYLLAVTDLRSTDPIGGAELIFYDYQQQELGRAKTGSDGLAKVELEEAPFVVVAKSLNEQGYLRMQDGEALSLSRFDVSGVSPQEGLKGFIYGERGVWRPGDSVFLNFVLEDEEATLPPNYPITFELRDPQGQLRESRTGVAPVGRLYPLYFTTQMDDPTGLWRARVKVGNATFYHTVKVETVKPNRIKVELDFGDDVLYAGNGTATGEVSANWLHGAPAVGLKATIEASFRSKAEAFPAFKGFEFRDPNREMGTNNTVAFDGPLNDQGQANFSISLPNQTAAPGPMTVGVRTRVFEKGGDFSTDNQQFEFQPYTNYAGLRLPMNSYGYPRLDIDATERVSFVSVNAQGKASSNRQLTAELYRVDWRWWWDNDYSNRSQYNRESLLNSLASTQLQTNGKGEASWDIKVEEWGRYLVRVCDTQSGHCAGGYVYAGRPWYGDEGAPPEAAMLMFKANKDSYQVGEKVELTFPAGDEGRALISLENGTEVLQSEWVEVKAGDNTYTFSAAAEMAPTIYAHVMIVQPHAQTDNDLPIRLYGVIPITVEDPSTQLTPTIAMPDELKPEQAFTVEIREEEGRPLTYTLAVVDEGLLSLTRFKTPNPWDAFYAREALGVRTWDMYNDVLGAQGAPLERVLGIGGGDLVGSPDADRANRFEPVVMHLGPFELPRKGKARHTLQMPNYVGAVRVMVVAAGNQAYGSVEKSVPVRKPLMALATLPRVLGVGESLELPVNIFAMKDHVKDVSIRLEESSGLVQIVEKQQRLQFSQVGDELVSFPVQVGQQTGIARFTITAEGNGERASQEIEIDIRNPNPAQTLVNRFVLAPGETQSQAYEPLGVAGTRSTVLEMTNLPPIDLERRLKYLLRYPYGCLEQTLSAGFPQLHLAKFMELTEEQKQQTQTNVQATINRLRRFQLTNGGFGYWPNASNPDQWSTSYVGHFLLEAQAAGYTLPGGMLDKWLQFQRQAARRWDPSLPDLGYVSKANYQLNQAYRLYTLALAQKAELGAMNQLREQTGLSNTSKWRLAAAYALAGQAETAKTLSNRLETTVEAYRELSYTYGSGIRDRAMILEALIVMGQGSAADRAAQLLSQDLSGDRWLSTQDIAFSLIAFSKYIGEEDQLSKTYTFQVQEQGGQAIDAGSDHPYMQIELADRRGSLQVKNTSQQKLFGAIIRRGQPLPEQEAPTSSLLNISVSYKNAEGQAVDVFNLPQGTDFVAEVKVSHPGQLSYRFQEMALRQVFPSGWEITNLRFEGLAREPESNMDYRDYRDDRVHTFFSIAPGAVHTYRVYLTASYQGRFYLPAFACEAMYDNKIFASTAGQWVVVGEPAVN